MKKIVDFLIEDWGIDENTAATLVVSISTFILGLLATLFINYTVVQIKKRAYRKGLKILLKTFFASCKKQYDILKDKGINPILSGEDLEIKVVSNHSLPYLKDIDKKDFILNFYSFWRKKRIKVITKILEIVETVSVTNTLFIDFFNVALKQFAEHESKFKEALTELRKINDKYITVNINDELTSEKDKAFTLSYFRIFKNWQGNGGDTRLAKVHQDIIVPVLELCRSSPLGAISQQEAIDWALQCNFAWINIEKIDSLITQKINQTANSYKRAYKLGTVILKALRV